MIEPEAAQAILERVREAAQDQILMDAHVHPFDVLVRDLRYRPDPARAGVFSAYDAAYGAPRCGGVSEDPDAMGAAGAVSADMAARFFLLNVRRLYAHTGPAVLADHLGLAHVGRCLLLPVAHAADDGQLDRMAEIFGDDPRFLFGYCPPDGLPDEGIADAVDQAVARHDVKVIKLHPGVSEIDVRRAADMARVERVLEASRLHRLGVVIHAGRSPHAAQPAAVDYGTLDRLREVDWSITDRPVVLAHAGAFGYPGPDAEVEVVPRLVALLARHDHLRVDLAGLGVTAMRAVLGHVDLARVLFGSDALYYAPCETMVRLAHALERSGIDVGEGVRAVAGRNPARLVGAGETPSCDGC